MAERSFENQPKNSSSKFVRKNSQVSTVPQTTLSSQKDSAQVTLEERGIESY